MFKLILFSTIVALTAAQAVTNYWPFTWQTCQFAGPNIAKVENLTLSAPVYHPGIQYFSVKGLMERDSVFDVVNGTVEMFRTVGTLRSKIACTILPLETGSVSIGSCKYPDLCDLVYDLLGVKNVPLSECPDYLLENGLDCRCPWNIPQDKTLDVVGEFDLVDLGTLGIDWLVEGNFEIGVTASHRGKALTCLNLRFGVAKNGVTSTTTTTTRRIGRKK